MLIQKNGQVTFINFDFFCEREDNHEAEMKTIIVLKVLIPTLPIITVIPNAEVPGEHPRRTNGVLLNSPAVHPPSHSELREAA